MDVHADGRLRDIQFLGSLCKTEIADYFHKGLELFEFHRGSSGRVHTDHILSGTKAGIAVTAAYTAIIHRGCTPWIDFR